MVSEMSGIVIVFFRRDLKRLCPVTDHFRNFMDKDRLRGLSAISFFFAQRSMKKRFSTVIESLMRRLAIREEARRADGRDSLVCCSFETSTGSMLINKASWPCC